MDLNTFRVDGPLPAVEPAKARTRNPRDASLGAKPPMRWLQEAAELGKAALATGLALWFKHGVRKGRPAPIRIDASLRRAMGLSQDQARRGFQALAEAGLVAFHRGGRGRCAEVTIVEHPVSPERNKACAPPENQP